MIRRVLAGEVAVFDRAVRTFGATAGGGEAFLGSPGALAFVACAGEDVHGWCWGYHLVRPDTSSMLYLHRLEVADGHRRRGVGRALLHAFMSAGAAAGATRMFLTTGASNVPARALYESTGGGLAAQGPTVNYWFVLNPVTGLRTRAAPTPQCRALLLSGVAGVGKSTVADAVGRLLTDAGHVTAVVDTDTLAQFGPPPIAATTGAWFYDELKCVNLASVWTNFRAVGTRFIVVAASVDSHALRDRYAQSLAGCDVRTVRLVADKEVVRGRLRQRDTGAKLDRHLQALDGDHGPALTTPTGHDLTVTNDRPPSVVAEEILARAGWVRQIS